MPKIEKTKVILLVLPPRFRIQGGTLGVTEEEEHGARTSLCLILDVIPDYEEYEYDCVEMQSAVDWALK